MCLSLAIFFLVVCLALEAFYRPWAYSAEVLEGRSLAGVFPSFLGVLVATFLLASRAKPGDSIVLMALTIFAGCLCYEFLQLFLPYATFDPLDLVAVILGSVVAALLLLAIHRAWP